MIKMTEDNRVGSLLHPSSQHSGIHKTSPFPFQKAAIIIMKVKLHFSEQAHPF